VNSRRWSRIPGFPFSRRRARGLSGVIVVLVFLLFWATRNRPGGPQGTGWGPPAEGTARPWSRDGGRSTAVRRVLVTRVPDGDTIALSGGERVRYLGIDAPETGEPFCTEAREENSRLVLDKEVDLRPGGPEGSDAYGRTLAVAYVREDPGKEPVCVSTELLRKGLAAVYIKGPDSVDPSLLAELLRAQDIAISNQAGFWGYRLARARSGGQKLVATRYRIHRSGCRELGGTAPRPVVSLQDELRKGKSFCRSCRPLGNRAP